jgi:signal transduction histidine kinase
MCLDILPLKTGFAMYIPAKTREELQLELSKLQREFQYLNALKDIDTTKRNRLEQDLAIALQEIAFQNEEKDKRAAELIIASLELTFQSEEKAKRANELVIANIEMIFQNKEKAKRAAELVIANKELAYQNELKETRATELIITNKELQHLIQLNKDKDKFFTIITHDLRNPFNSIIGFSEHLKDCAIEKNHEEIEEYANIIHQSSKRAMDLLMNLMVWAQSQSGRMVFNPENFNIVTLIDQTTLLLKDIAEQKSILIESKFPSSFEVYADKEMISAVLRNLISNAIKFTQPDGKITVTVEQKKNELIVSVSDTGVGISKERIDKLFEISDIYSSPGTQKETGTGLGLILCKEFINKNNGEIWINSEARIGTTISFSLPIILN